MPVNAIRLGDLRYEVTLAKRSHTVDEFNLADVDLDTLYTDRITVRAAIYPIGSHPFLSNRQLEIGAVTHRIIVRWHPGVTQSDVILRESRLPDGSTRTVLYRVHGTESLDGRTRFLAMDAELEERTQ